MRIAGKFLLTLLNALMYLPSRVNFRNLGRYTDCNEKCNGQVN